MTTLAQQITQKQELTDHLALVKQRIVDEDLSTIELRRKSRLLMDEANDTDLYDSERELAMAELDLVEGMIAEQQASEPSPSDIADHMESTGDLIGAETLRHTIGLDASRTEIEQAQASLATLKEEGLHSANYIEAAETKIQALQDAFDEMPKVAPVHQRHMDAEALTQEGNTKRDSAALLEDSGDAGVVEQAASLREESDKAFQDALGLRSFVPAPANTDGTTVPEGGEPAPLSSFERNQLYAMGQRRGGTI